MILTLGQLNKSSKANILVLVATLALSACGSDDDGASDSLASDDATISETDGDTDSEANTDTTGEDTTDTDTTGGGITDVDTDTEGDGTATDTGNDGGAIANDESGATESDSMQLAFAATATFPTGQIERISIDDGFVVNGTYPATESDIRVATDGEAIYQIGRFMLDSLTRFDPLDTSIVEFQFSVNGDETAVNPFDVIFVNDTKAYVLRYGSPFIWIINPSAETEDEFMTGSIDISAYDPDLTDTDLSPNAESGVIVDGQLFVLMQRLSVFDPIETGYVAVFDVETDTEIDTGQGVADGLNGIPLGSLNPVDIRYNETTEEIYVTGRGNIFEEFNMLPGDPYTGGLFAIDQETFTVSQLLDDGDENNNMGFIEHTLVLSDEKGYVSLFLGSDPNTFTSINNLHTFNPSTGEIGPIVSAVADQSLANLTMGSDGTVWVGINGDAPGFTRLDTQSDMAVEPFVSTSFSPLNVVFLNIP